MSAIHDVLEFLLEYSDGGHVSVNALIESLYRKPQRKYNRFKSKKFLTKLLRILVKRGIITEHKYIKRHYYIDRIYDIDLDRIKQYMDELDNKDVD